MRKAKTGKRHEEHRFLRCARLRRAPVGMTQKGTACEGDARVARTMGRGARLDD